MADPADTVDPDRIDANDEPGGSASGDAASTATPRTESPSLGSRILITWVSLTAVAVIGGFLSSTVTGPVGFIVFLATSLAVVAILLYNVNELVENRIAAGRQG